MLMVRVYEDVQSGMDELGRRGGGENKGIIGI